MLNFFQKFRDFIARPTHSRTMGVLVMFVLVSAVFLTVNFAQQQQTIKQRAYSTCQDLILGQCVENYCDGITCSIQPNCPSPLINYSGDFASCPLGWGCCAAADQSTPPYEPPAPPPVEPPAPPPVEPPTPPPTSELCCPAGYDDGTDNYSAFWHCSPFMDTAINCCKTDSHWGFPGYIEIPKTTEACNTPNPPPAPEPPARDCYMSDDNVTCYDRYGSHPPTCDASLNATMTHFCIDDPSSSYDDYCRTRSYTCGSDATCTIILGIPQCSSSVPDPAVPSSCQDSTTGNGNNCDGDNGHFEGYCSPDHVFINLYGCNGNSCQAESPYRCSDSGIGYTCQINFAGVPQCLPGNTGPTPTPTINPTTPPIYPTSPPTPISSITPTSTTSITPTAVPTVIPTVTLVSALNAQDISLNEASLSARLILYNLTTNTVISGAPMIQSFSKTPIPEDPYVPNRTLLYSTNITLTGLYEEKYFLVIRYNNMIAKSVFTVSNATRTITVPTTTLVFGDINNDNDVDLVTDYSIFKSCWKQPATDACSSSDFDQSGGNIDEVDYNTWLRGFATWHKEGEDLTFN